MCRVGGQRFGVPTFCSTTAPRNALPWKRALEVVFCHLRATIMVIAMARSQQDRRERNLYRPSRYGHGSEEVIVALWGGVCM